MRHAVAAIVTGAGSTWTNNNTMVVGHASAGELRVADGGVVSGPIILGSGAAGLITIGGAPAAAGYITGNISFGGSDANVVFTTIPPATITPARSLAAEATRSSPSMPAPQT